MKVMVAQSAGFCFGVKLALDCVYEKAKTDNICTYGPIIHNKNVIKELEDLGVNVINNLDYDNIDKKVIIRSHGVSPDIYTTLEERNIEYIDCTCPFVKKIHKIVSKNHFLGKKIIIVGNSEHPEVIGINGYADNEALIAIDTDEILALNIEDDKEYVLVAQTTYDTTIFDDIVEKIKDINNISIFNTICSATNDRQKEAMEISRKVDYMIVLGDTNSSNSRKLYDICKKNCKNTYFCETISDLRLNISSKNVKIGITAGASTPPAIIKEALNKMNEIEMSFEEMLNESYKPVYNGSIVEGSVIRVTENEIFVNLGYKADGIIEKSEYSDDLNLDLRTKVSVGDTMEVYVMKVNDGDGNVLLSKKKVELDKGYVEIEKIFNNKEIVKGTIIEVIKGGFIADINGIRAFVPSSQISNKFIQNLEDFKGKEFNFNIIEFNRIKRRVIAGRRDIAQAEEEALKEEIYSKIQAGDIISGKISRIVDFGAFVDLGGVDGLIHISELSWGRVKKVSDVLSEGDEVQVYVLEIDRSREKISLSLKGAVKNPWELANEKYNLEDIVEGKVVRIVAFGAFVEIEPGIDGLVHISQISDEHISKPEEALSIGDVIKAKITEIDVEKRRISLSIKDFDNQIKEQ